MTNAALANRAQARPLAPAYKAVEVGRVLTVGSSVAVMSINKSIIRNGRLHMAQIGTILKIITSESVVVAMVSSLRIGATDDEGLGDGCLANLNILGEITTNPTTKETKFFRGVRSFPVLNEAIYNMSPEDLRLIFNKEKSPCIEIGRLQQDNSIIAKVRTDDLLSKHFAILGSTGSGKSCTVALVLQAILKENGNAHVVLFDPHNEYSKSFGDKAEVISNDTLDIPLWMFDFVESTELLTSDIEDHAREETDVLHDVLLKAKRLYDRSMKNGDTSAQTKMDDVIADLQRAAHITLDSPVPYRIRDVLKLLDHEMGRLENNSNLGPYKRLKRRIQMLMADPRYQFIFRNQASPLPIDNLVGRIFRIPVAGKPISILDFSGIPSEALNVVVSVVARLAFELATWSERRIPVLLVCEEAHRYIPADKSLGFHSTRRIIGRIAKEGRKYGVSLGIISQRPSELEASTLSQCSTIFSMRLSNELDQNFVRAAVPDGAAELLSFLPSLGTAETMVFGESVNLPMRIILNTLEEEYRPHSSSAEFTDLWNRPDVTPEFMATVFERWRARSLGKNTKEGAVDAVTGTSQRAVQSVRNSLRQQTTTPQLAGQNPQPQLQQQVQQQLQPQLQPQAHKQPLLNPATATAAQMRERLQSVAAKSSGVKSMLNTAFNRDM